MCFYTRTETYYTTNMKIDNVFLGKISNNDIYKTLNGSNCSGIFLDIETTGLKRDRDTVYLIGIMYPCTKDSDPDFNIRLFFAESPLEEKDILRELSLFLEDYKKDSGINLSFITFNGDRFDIPFLKARFLLNNIPCPAALADTVHTDIYKLIKPYRKYFGLSHLNQKSIEKLLKINREDTYTGGELINVYKEYSGNKDPELYKLLITHNRDDVYGMSGILPVISYSYIFSRVKSDNRINSDDRSYSIIRSGVDSHISFDGTEVKEFIIEFHLPCRVPVPHLFHNDRIFLSVNENTGVLRLPVFEGELKHYFDNYKDYYYIPSEDRAILKTLGSLMDPETCEKAKADNCYIRFSGDFLPLSKEDRSITIYRPERKCNFCYGRLEDIKNTPDLREYLINIIAYAFS